MRRRWPWQGRCFSSIEVGMPSRNLKVVRCVRARHHLGLHLGPRYRMHWLSSALWMVETGE